MQDKLSPPMDDAGGYRRMSPFPTNKFTLKQILDDETPYPYSRQEFHAFLRAEHTAENLQFWLEATEYRSKGSKIYARYYSNPIPPPRPSNKSKCLQAVSSNGYVPPTFNTSINSSRLPTQLKHQVQLTAEEHETLLSALHDIVGNYLTTGEENELNIPGAMRRNVVEEILERQCVAPNVLDVITECVYEMMRMGSFSRFMSRPAASPLSASDTSSSIDSITTERLHSLSRPQKSPTQALLLPNLIHSASVELEADVVGQLGQPSIEMRRTLGRPRASSASSASSVSSTGSTVIASPPPSVVKSSSASKSPQKRREKAATQGNRPTNGHSMSDSYILYHPVEEPSADASQVSRQVDARVPREFSSGGFGGVVKRSGSLLSRLGLRRQSKDASSGADVIVQ
ncbi:RGS domain-containing protein [Phlyctochytrium arcticum]|nr:RGS domain-containing protein [Phlyctochytrium arcticum]